MPATITTTGIGAIGDIGSHSVQEDATPIAIGVASASTPNVSFVAERVITTYDLSEWSINNSATLEHPLGHVHGRIDSVSVKQGTVNGVLTPLMGDLAVDRTVPTLWQGGVISNTLTTDTVDSPIFIDSNDNFFRSFPGTMRVITPTGFPNDFVLTGSVIVTSYHENDAGTKVVSGTNDHKVYIFDTSDIEGGSLASSTSFGSVGTGNGQFTSGSKIYAVVDGSGNIYAADTGNARIQKFNSSGVYQSQWATIGTGVLGMAIDSTGVIYYMSSTGVVYLYNTAGASFGPWTDLDLNNITGTKIIDFQDLIYITDNDGFYIYSINGEVLDSFSVMELAPGETVKSISANSHVVFVKTYATDGHYIKFSTDTPRVSEVIEYYVNQVVSGLTIDYTASTNPVLLVPGFVGNVWQKLNELCAALDIEIASINGELVVRDTVITEIPFTEYGVSPTITINAKASARFIDITYTSVTSGYNVEMYNAYQDDNKIMSVNAGATAQYILNTNSYPSQLDQPTIAPYSGGGVVPDPDPGLYSVSGSDGLPIVDSQWITYGGSVSVSIGENPNQIVVDIIGPQEIPGVPGPYKLALSDGQNDYAFFSVVGNGLSTTLGTVMLATGADPDKTPVEVFTVSPDNIFIQSEHQAYDRGVWLADRLGAPSVQLSATLSIDDISGFGLVAGSRIRYADSIYRIDSATITETEVSFNASRYVTVADKQVVWPPGTTTSGTYATFWDGAPSENEIIRPLRIT